jgi:hypothetical protein
MATPGLPPVILGVAWAAVLVYWQYTASGAAENVVTLVATEHYFQQWDSMINRIVTGAHCSDTTSFPDIGLCWRPLNATSVAAIETARVSGSGRLELGLLATHNAQSSGQLYNYTQPQKPRLAVYMRPAGAVAEPDRIASRPYRLTTTPNPARAGFITADLAGTRRGRVQYEVRTVVGTKVASGDKATAEGRTRILVDIGRLPAGVYMFTVADGKMSVTQSFTIAR